MDKKKTAFRVCVFFSGQRVKAGDFNFFLRREE